MHEKPLRISGEMSKCQRAKEMVLDLIAEKDMEVGEQVHTQHGAEDGICNVLTWETPISGIAEPEN